MRFEVSRRINVPRFKTSKWLRSYPCALIAMTSMWLSFSLANTASAYQLFNRFSNNRNDVVESSSTNSGAAYGQVELAAGRVEVDTPPTRLRVVWGGGEAKAWQGIFRLSDGRLNQMTTLGIEPDSAGALNNTGQTIKVQPLRRSDFSGFDITVSDTSRTTLNIEMSSGVEGESPIVRTIDLTPLLIDFDTTAIQIALDDSGNRIDINRAPGEEIPVAIERPHMVFEPGELFEFEVVPFLVPRELANVDTLNLELLRDGKVLPEANEEYSLHRHGDRLTTIDPARIELPQEEGVYTVRLRVQNESLSSRLNINRVTLQRDLQLVVVDSRPLDQRVGNQNASQDIAMWQQVYDSSDARTEWLERLQAFPQVRFASTGQADNTGVKPVELDSGPATQFAPGGWQTLPLRVKELNKPHIVEIEYLDDGPMAMGFSILQPDGQGQIQPFGVDSGIGIPENEATGEPKMRRHRIFFWPEHETPHLLFANRHRSRSATIGSVKVYAGPNRLANATRSDEAATAKRQFLAFYEKPLFAENFVTRRSIDPVNEQPVHDWQTFMEGADRWTQYLKAAGYTGAMLVVAGDGSALYPSELLQPSPNFDSGVFASTGQDPMRKDIVELLARVFQREGLTLVPVLHFNSTLPELERQINEDPSSTAGITLQDLQGETLRNVFRNSSEPRAIYNPLDSRVQSAYADVVDEFAQRFQGHPSIGGVGFLLSRDSILTIPGQTWGADQNTLDRFAQQSRMKELPEYQRAESQGGEQFSIDAWTRQYLVGLGRPAWLQWRQDQMAGWTDLLKQKARPLTANGKMFLLGGDMLATQDAFSALAPSLRRGSDMNDAFARIAFPAEAISNDPEIVFLRSFEIAPEKTIVSNRLNIQLENNEQQSVASNASSVGGVLFSHRSSWAEFQQLQKRDLFGKPQQQPIMRLQPLVPSGKWNRRRFANGLLQSDSQYMVEGGWLSILGQEDQINQFVESFTQLPNVPFQDVLPAESPKPATRIVVRQANVDDRNYFYLVNPTPWNVTASIQLSGNNTIVESLGESEYQFDESFSEPVITIEMEPFAMQAGFTTSNVSVASWSVQLPDVTASHLQERLNSLVAKVSRAEQAEPIQVLTNPGFEVFENVEGEQPDFGWVYDRRGSDQVMLRRGDAAEGDSVLTLKGGESAVSIRSNPFRGTETGRLSITVLIRTDQPDVQPPLRIALQGDDGMQVYYRYGNVGGEARPITTEWQEFAVHFDDLPLEGTGEFQIGFDLMGLGVVDLDRVKVFDRWMDDQDSQKLTQRLALAGYQLGEGQDIGRCRQILNGYWPQFLDEFFPDETRPEAQVAEENRSPRSSRVPGLSNDR